MQYMVSHRPFHFLPFWYIHDYFSSTNPLLKWSWLSVTNFSPGKNFATSGRKWRSMNKHYTVYRFVCTTEDACPWRSNISKDSSSLHYCRPATIDFQSSIPAEVHLWGCHLERDKGMLGWLRERDSQEVSCISNFFCVYFHDARG